MLIHEIQSKIQRLKREKNICILVHAYQSHDIWEIADYVGDSFGLSQKAAESDAETVIMCGVRFMAETVKILSPQKRVILSNAEAGCPMAEQISVELLSQLKAKYPDYMVVSYINTTANLKTLSDVCVTSSSAVKIVKNIENEKILFIPDCNLGSWVQKQIPEKQFQFVPGGCPTHLLITPKHVEQARIMHPNALLLVHPECSEKVVELADYVGSTTQIMDFAKKNPATEFIIGTENSIVQHLQFDCPDKRFFALSKNCVCHNMKMTTLGDVYECVRGIGGEEISLDADTLRDAKRSIDEMLRLEKL
ncbi:MAG: quinolinate synthase NadA [Bacteroidales bacterium]|nr:quinolinate synthase NadA [Bacteroidales bacterium]MBR4689836.1 quinolinate synthase NadA [Bacteroidales bacterium]MBR7036131.1 quinolinate synthase NadA [Bacteroidales bacterium]